MKSRELRIHVYMATNIGTGSVTKKMESVHGIKFFWSDQQNLSLIVREPTRQISVSVYWFVMPILIVNHSGILVNKVSLLFRRFNWSYIFVFSGQVKFVLYYYSELNFSSTA